MRIGKPISMITDEKTSSSCVFVYRLERISENACWLYSLDDVHKEPDDYKVRFKLEKLF